MPLQRLTGMWELDIFKDPQVGRYSDEEGFVCLSVSNEQHAMSLGNQAEVSILFHGLWGNIDLRTSKKVGRVAGWQGPGVNSCWFLAGLHPNFFLRVSNFPLGNLPPIVCRSLGWKMCPGAMQKLSKCLLLYKLPHFRAGTQQREWSGDLHVYLVLSYFQCLVHSRYSIFTEWIINSKQMGGISLIKTLCEYIDLSGLWSPHP